MSNPIGNNLASQNDIQNSFQSLIDSTDQALNDELDALTSKEDLSTAELTAMQTKLNQFQLAQTTLSNCLSKIFDTASKISSNIR